MALVDSKDPNAKPLPVAKMMVHHFLYFAGGRVDPRPRRGAWGTGSSAGAGRSTRTGVSTRCGRRSSVRGTASTTSRVTAPLPGSTLQVLDGDEPLQAVQALLRAHEGSGTTTEPRQTLSPAHDRQLLRTWSTGCPTTSPGGGAAWLDVRRTRSTWTAPLLSGRILGGGSHHHGGALHQSLRSVTCGRTLFDAKAYYGADDHPYNTIRPILHEPGPIANGTFRSPQASR